ncbi:MAG: pseudomurein-binding protein, partial [Methanobacterium sp.]|nr:pseudomurein-binding protein [Methanobacterium sp.]
MLVGMVLIFNLGGVSAASTSSTTALNHTKTTTVKQSVVKINFTQKQINTAAAKVKSYYDTNQKLPCYVNINNYKVTMPQFLQLITDDIYLISNKKTSSITLKNVTAASKPVENVKTGQLTKTQYINLAKTTRSYIYANGKAPNNENSSLGTIKFQNLVYSFSKILAFQAANNRLPNYVSVAPLSKSLTTIKSGSSAQAIVDSIGYAEAKFEDIQGQSSPSVMENCGYGDCWADSGWLYNKLSKAGIAVRIIGHTTGSYPLHRWIELNIANGWKTWDYAKYNSPHHGPTGSGPSVV